MDEHSILVRRSKANTEENERGSRELISTATADRGKYNNMENRAQW